MNRQKISVLELDWTNLDNAPHGPFDLILGADLVYNKEYFKPLKDTLIHFMKPGTRCLLAGKIRYPKDRRFYEKLKRDFHVREVKYEADVDVTVFEILK